MAAKYTHSLVWSTRAKSGALADLDICREYACFNDMRTRAHIVALKQARDVSHVHLVRVY